MKNKHGNGVFSFIQKETGFTDFKGYVDKPGDTKKLNLEGIIYKYETLQNKY